MLNGFVHMGTLEEGSRASTEALMRGILVSSASVLSFSSSMVVTCLELESKGDFCDGSGLKKLSIPLNLCLNTFPHRQEFVSGVLTQKNMEAGKAVSFLLLIKCETSSGDLSGQY